MAAEILVVEDEATARRVFHTTLERAGLPSHCVASGEEAVTYLDEGGRCDAALLDLNLPGAIDGMALLPILRNRCPEVAVVVVTGYASIESAVAAVHAGAADYLAKPVDPQDLLLRLRRALDHRDLVVENRRLHHALDQRLRFEGLIGDSPAMTALRTQLAQLAEIDATVLITGETGTGKELAARTLHFHGPRKQAPFVPLDCGSYTEELLGDALFGHRPGAFTGAGDGRPGLFEEAADGTVFLDEVQNLTPAMQAKFLRILEERTIRRLGGGPEIAIRARIVAAVNTDLEEALAAGRFRSDLYYRLNVMRVDLPPLRERDEDILTLARHFLAAHGRRHNRPAPPLTAPMYERLRAYPWPGNVRELANLMERAVIFGSTEEVVAGLAAARHPDVPCTLAELEQEAIRAALAACNGRKEEAAHRLGIDATTLRRKLRRYGDEP